MNASWLADVWAKELIDVLQTMTMQEFQATVGNAPPPDSEATFWWQQAFSIASEAPLLVGASSAAWIEFGRRSLQAAGIDEVDEETARSTFLEIVQQSFTAVARVLSQRLGRPVECIAVGECDAPYSMESASSVQLAVDSSTIGTLFLSVSAAFENALSSIEKDEVSSTELPGTEVSTRHDVKPAPSRPKPIDLLLDIEMPVSVSFGKAHLPLRDVLKFTSGSIVELNRHPEDPVEIVVNNCVIARGEVVVVEGTYAVRIQEIVSRQRRLAVPGFDRTPTASSR